MRNRGDAYRGLKIRCCPFIGVQTFQLSPGLLRQCGGGDCLFDKLCDRRNSNRRSSDRRNSDRRSSAAGAVAAGAVTAGTVTTGAVPQEQCRRSSAAGAVTTGAVTAGAVAGKGSTAGDNSVTGDKHSDRREGRGGQVANIQDVFSTSSYTQRAGGHSAK